MAPMNAPFVMLAVRGFRGTSSSALAMQARGASVCTAVSMTIRCRMSVSGCKAMTVPRMITSPTRSRTFWPTSMLSSLCVRGGVRGPSRPACHAAPRRKREVVVDGAVGFLRRAPRGEGEEGESGATFHGRLL